MGSPFLYFWCFCNVIKRLPIWFFLLLASRDLHERLLVVIEGLEVGLVESAQLQHLTLGQIGEISESLLATLELRRLIQLHAVFRIQIWLIKAFLRVRLNEGN